MRKRNWSQYNANLVKRGSITFLIDPSVLKIVPELNSRGRPFLFSQALLQMLFMLKIHYRLTYRSLEGFSKSLIPLMGYQVALPTYSLICKRASTLVNSLPKLSSRRPHIIMLDATGVKVFGEGEWKRKIHGASTRRKWLKIHIAVDAKTQEIISVEATKSSITDCIVGPKLIDKCPKSMKKTLADGGYDTRKCISSIEGRGAKPLIPPRRNARLGLNNHRNASIVLIKLLGGDLTAKRLWGKLTGYSRRALVETAFSRLKTLYGDKFFSKKFETQKVETHLKCLLLNKMMNQKAA